MKGKNYIKEHDMNVKERRLIDIDIYQYFISKKEMLTIMEFFA